MAVAAAYHRVENNIDIKLTGVPTKIHNTLIHRMDYYYHCKNSTTCLHKNWRHMSPTLSVILGLVVHLLVTALCGVTIALYYIKNFALLYSSVIIYSVGGLTLLAIALRIGDTLYTLVICVRNSYYSKNKLNGIFIYVSYLPHMTADFATITLEQKHDNALIAADDWNCIGILSRELQTSSIQVMFYTTEWSKKNELLYMMRFTLRLFAYLAYVTLPIAIVVFAVLHHTNTTPVKMTAYPAIAWCVVSVPCALYSLGWSLTTGYKTISTVTSKVFSVFKP
jgi:hypothetical protein